MVVAERLGQRLDDIGKPAWIAIIVVGFILFHHWPVGLAVLGVLAFLVWSGRMGCWKHGRRLARWHEEGGMERMHDKVSRWYDDSRRTAPTSGNRAFDEYREETLRRLEDEQREFFTFLERLRMAKDKSEFDEFLAERRRRPPQAPEPQPQG